MHKPIVVLVLAALLAGCSGDTPEPAGDGPAATGMRIEGIVQSLAFEPIAGANVTIPALNLTQPTGPDGRFAIPGLPEAIYNVHAEASGFLPSTLVAQPTGGIVGLDFQLTPMPRLEPRNETLQYKGTLQCALEAVIITPSCDSVIVAANDAAEENDQGRPLPEPLEQNASFVFEVEQAWRTIVIDVIFDPESAPGLDGMRLTLRGVDDANSTGTYEQYGRFTGQQPFTARIEPNATYDEGVRPVPATATTFKVEIYPHSHAWHQVCIPFCTLGVGAGVDVQFQVIVTAFYVEPAPEGWTKRS